MRPATLVARRRSGARQFFRFFLAASAFSAFAISILPLPALAAEDWYTGASKTASSDDWIVAVDASTTYTSNKSQFAIVGSTIAVDGRTLAQTGTRLRLEGLAGTYAYADPATGQQIHGQQFQGGLLVGYEKIYKNASIAGYVGVDIRDNSLSTADINNSTVGTTAGVKAVAEAYLQPTDLTMFSAYASYSTAHDAYYARVRAGYRVFDNGYMGPELTFLGDEYFGQSRIGAHLSGLQLAAFQLGISGGYGRDRFNKGGYYATLDARTGF